jgi:hypothetical protein
MNLGNFTMVTTLVLLHQVHILEPWKEHNKQEMIDDH